MFVGADKGRGSLPRRRILVVDDDPRMATLLREILEEDGYQATLARNGRQALETARRFRPELIVLDPRLTRLEGHSFAERYRRGGNAPILVVTALAPVDFSSIAPAAVLRKPFDLDNFLETVRRVLAERSAAHAPEAAGG